MLTLRSNTLAVMVVILGGLIGAVVLGNDQPSKSILSNKLIDARMARMASTVTIYRDAYGVPHVYGPTDASCIFGFIYAQAEDYFWQIEDNYLRALGRACEAYGEKSLADDLLNRALETTRISQQEFEQASPRMKELCQALADGLNYYLTTHPNVKPRVISHFEPWHPLAFRRFMLYQSFIYRNSGLNATDVLAVVKEVQNKKEAAINIQPAMLAAMNSDEQLRALHSEHVGSNMWAVRPEKTTSGKAMLFINPHQPFFGPGQWYEGHVVSEEGWNLLGACFFGSPCPTIGYNGHLAWSHTVNQPDIVDTYQVMFDEKNPLHYRYGNNTKPLTCWNDMVTVKTDKGMVTRTFRFSKTHQGPIVAIRDKKSLAVRLAKYDSGGGLEEWYNMGKAKNLAEFKEAMKPCNIPMFNAMVADKEGNIFYVYNGAIPKRSTKFDWSKPVDGSDPETEWQGYHAFNELPQMENPKCGFLQNCNQQPLTTTPLKSELKPGEVEENPKADQYPPYFMRERDRDNGRARISRRILSSSSKFDFESWAKAGFNTKVIEAEARVPELIKEWEALQKTDAGRAAKLNEVVELLRGWDGVSSVDSVPMTLFAMTFDRIMQMVQKRDLAMPLRIRALEATIADLEKQHGTWKVAWGEINRLQRIHGSQIDLAGRGAFRDDQPSLPVAGSPGPLGIVFNFYTFPQTGQKRRYGVAGSSYVGVVELAEQTHAKTVLQFGQSGDPASPHWFDQAKLYARGEYKPSWFRKTEIETNSKRSYHPGESVQNGSGQ